MSPRTRPRLGDLIEIHRTGYAHWAIYVGDGYVVHLTSTDEFAGATFSSLMSTLTEKAMVKKELLSQVAGTNDYEVNNKYDDRHPPLPINKVVKWALELVGKEIRYSLTSMNCEHFVTKLRYGIALSEQVEEKITKIAVGTGLLAGLGLIGMLVARSRRERQ
ncbi:phospholipase A and acyltransferase 2-like [Erethizon dorsatum]